MIVGSYSQILKLYTFIIKIALKIYMVKRTLGNTAPLVNPALCKIRPFIKVHPFANPPFYIAVISEKNLV